MCHLCQHPPNPPHTTPPHTTHRDGQPRQMAFVGYRTVEDAAAALRYFNNTFIDTSRISIEV